MEGGGVSMLRGGDLGCVRREPEAPTHRLEGEEVTRLALLAVSSREGE